MQIAEIYNAENIPRCSAATPKYVTVDVSDKDIINFRADRVNDYDTSM